MEVEQKARELPDSEPDEILTENSAQRKRRVFEEQSQYPEAFAQLLCDLRDYDHAEVERQTVSSLPNAQHSQGLIRRSNRFQRHVQKDHHCRHADHQLQLQEL